MQTINGVAVTDSQAEVYTILSDYGPLPDVALVPLAQHVAQSHQSSSGIRTRRRELLDKGLLARAGRTVTLPSGRKAQFYGAAR